MKKLFALMLAVMLVLSLAACGSNEVANPELVITRAPEADTKETEAPVEATEAPAVEATEAPVAEELYFFVYEGVEIIPGAAFDPAALPEAESLYTVPSCALEGTDNVYNYGGFEVTAFAENGSEFVYSVYLMDPNIATAEGLALGDEMSKVLQLYGEDYAEEGAAIVYTRGETMLYIIAQDDVVISIEYRWKVQ